MDLTGLFHVLAWLQILPRLASSEGPEASPDWSGPRKTLPPILRLYPPRPRYQAGDSVTLTCTAPLPVGRLGFSFLHGTESVHVGASAVTSRSYQIPRLGLEHTGTHTCQYWVEQDGPESPSPHSRPISIALRNESPSASDPDPPAAPTLSLGSQNPVYYQGAQIHISCSAPAGEGVTSYRFYRGRGNQPPEELPSPSRAARLELRAQAGEEGPYSCRYWRNVSGKEILSRESNKAYVTVQAPPAAPTLSLHPPEPFYLPDERVTLRCSAPEGERPQGYRLYRGQEGPIIHKELPSPDGGARLEIVAKMGNAGPYTCAYWTLKSGREIPSERSRPVSLSVRAPLAAPTLSLHPSEPFYLPDERVTLRCSAPEGERPRGYKFYRGQEGRVLEELRTPHGGTWLEIVAEMGNAGLYTCEYWTLQSRREIPSLGSWPVSLSVQAPPPAPTLSLDPVHAVYLPGERIQLSCSAPGAEDVTGYGFYKLRPEQVTEELLLSRGGPRLEIQAAMWDEGPYACRFWSRISGREIASGLSRPIAVPVADRPGSPSVSVSPDYPAYVAGERVEIHCSAPLGASPAQYEFYEPRKPFRSPLGNASSWQTDLHASGTGNVTLSYSCVYTQLIQGRPITSHASHTISLAVFPALAPPALQLSPPQPLYVTGETVMVECLVPPGPHITRAHTVFKDGHPLPEPSGPPVALNVSPSDSGTYSCGFSTELRGRRLPSPPSRPVPLAVIDPPPRPALSVDPPSGAVGKGLPLHITCTAPMDAGERTFHFYQNGTEILPGAAGSEIRTTEPGAGARNVFVLSIPRAGPDSAGEFTCGYEKNMSGRWVLSPRSPAVNVTVTGKGRPPLIPLTAWCVGTAAVLPLLFIICLCRGKKETASRHRQSL